MGQMFEEGSHADSGMVVPAVPAFTCVKGYAVATAATKGKKRFCGKNPETGHGDLITTILPVPDTGNDHLLPG